MVKECSHVEIIVKIVPDRWDSTKALRREEVKSPWWMVNMKRREREDIKSERRLGLSYIGP